MLTTVSEDDSSADMFPETYWLHVNMSGACHIHPTSLFIEYIIWTSFFNVHLSVGVGAFIYAVQYVHGDWE